ncbi:SpoIIE family protein phosphatase [Sphaerisporangium aureirubrum]|uniref:SpoIIE family protein phosphatase n=1 Tax=Sphaerisporangium aureirubrum TaxID=1544736 RepID=A0ABW1NPL4_9ACTN
MLIASGLLAVLIGLVFGTLFWAITDMLQATDARKHVRTALSEANRLETLVLDLETGARGFLITRDQRFLQPWESARAALPGQAQRVVSLSDTPELRGLAREIGRDGNSYVRDYSDPLIGAAKRGDPSAWSVETTAEGKRRVDDFRARFDRFDDVARSVLAAREQATETRVRWSIVAATGGLAGSVLLIAAYTGYLTRAIVRPVRRAAAVAARLADGDLAARMPETGAGEIGELGVAFNSMGNSLTDSRRLTQEAHRRLKLLYDTSKAVGTTLDVERTAEELVRAAVPSFADFVTVDLPVSVMRGDGRPPGEEDTLCRAAMGGIGGTAAFRPVGTLIDWEPATPQARSFRRGVGMIEPDLRSSVAWRSRDRLGTARILDHGFRSLITTPLRAQGTRMGVVSLWRLGEFDEEDLSCATELVAKAGVAIDNARRYTHERNTALALQCSLLPKRLPPQPAVEIASRYQPAGAGAGVGGDWFDVIPLSGCRVGLVVGDVVGHGIHASATMGRLRTAVRTLADVDLPPDELLTHLDDLVLHLSSDDQPGMAQGEAPTAGELGATCLYAVYDPVSRCCTMATAGHPLPVLVPPDGPPELVSGPVGPPLGIGGLPFETTELLLTAGSVLALFTDGLIESRDHDIDHGLTELRHALAFPTASLEDTCDHVTDAMLDGRATDDTALLLVRTGALSPGQFATWDLPDDPALVSHARKLALDQLAVWKLDEMQFVTELVVSELVTNAIRYGTPPIQLRLIRSHTLICEVSDGSSTAPHLRRARVFDEGGRGLLLVAQLTQGWGTRQTTSGKTIWCEQTLPPTTAAHEEFPEAA